MVECEAVDQAVRVIGDEDHRAAARNRSERFAAGLQMDGRLLQNRCGERKWRTGRQLTIERVETLETE